MSRFEPPSIRERGQLARAIAAVQQHKPEHGESSGKITCTRCGAALRFTIDSSGISRGQCIGNCGVRWCQ
jgi:hypothetical protein